MPVETEAAEDDTATTIRHVVDDDGRRLRFLRSQRGGAGFGEELRALYDRFDDAGRAQGVPPASPQRRREWLENFLGAPGVGVVAWHEGDAVGHGRLLGDRQGPAELAVFVGPGFRDAGVGTSLLRTLLSLARERELSEVVLSVERSNTAARALYRRFGFETVNRGRFEMEMRLPL